VLIVAYLVSLAILGVLLYCDGPAPYLTLPVGLVVALWLVAMEDARRAKRESH